MMTADFNYTSSLLSYSSLTEAAAALEFLAQGVGAGARAGEGHESEPVVTSSPLPALSCAALSLCHPVSRNAPYPRSSSAPLPFPHGPSPSQLFSPLSPINSSSTCQAQRNPEPPDQPATFPLFSFAIISDVMSSLTSYRKKIRTPRPPPFPPGPPGT